jgi:hypothetical protein
MSSTDNTPRQFRTFRMRRKVSTGTADLARWAYTDGDSFDVTVGGTASDGNYVVTITPLVRGAAVPTADPSITPIAVTVTRATTPATNANIATQLVTNANATLVATNPHAASSLSTYIESVSSSGAVTSWIVKRGAPPFIVTTSETTATGTIEATPDDVFPVTFDTLGWASPTGPRTSLGIVLVPVSATGVPLDPGTLTADLTVRRYFDRGRRDGRDIPATPVGVENATTSSAWAAGAAFRIAGGGGRFGVSLGAVAGAVGSGVIAALEVHVREVTE